MKFNGGLWYALDDMMGSIRRPKRDIWDYANSGNYVGYRNRKAFNGRNSLENSVLIRSLIEEDTHAEV